MLDRGAKIYENGKVSIPLFHSSHQSFQWRSHQIPHRITRHSSSKRQCQKSDGCVDDVQFLILAESSLSAAIEKIPKNELDFDPDWEVDPTDLKLMDKLGISSVVPYSCLSLNHTAIRSVRAYDP